MSRYRYSDLEILDAIAKLSEVDVRGAKVEDIRADVGASQKALSVRILDLARQGLIEPVADIRGEYRLTARGWGMVAES